MEVQPQNRLLDTYDRSLKDYQKAELPLVFTFMEFNRRRSRRILLCISCHLKKRKCDRNLPCDTCIRNGLRDSCNYEFIPTALETASRVERELRKKIESLELKLHILESTNESSTDTDLSPSLITSSDTRVALTTVDKGDKYSFRRALNTNSHGEYKIFPIRSLMAPLSMVTGDPIVPLMWAFFQVLQHNQLSTSDLFVKNKILAKEKVNALNRHLIEYYGESYISRLGPDPKRDDILAVRKSISRFGHSFGIAYSTKLEFTLVSLIDKVKCCLPPYHTTLEMVSLFFSRRCPGYFEVPKERFEASVRRILRPTDPEGLIQIFVSGKEDYAVLSMLLLMLRLVYLSLLDPFAKFAEGIALPEPMIHMDSVDVAQELLSELDITGFSNMEHLQALLLMFRYRMVAPEYDCYTRSFDATASFSLVSILAKALNLNEDPDNWLPWVPQGKKEAGESQFLRRMAMSMIILNVHVSTIYGPPFLLHVAEFVSNTPHNIPDSDADIDSINKLYTRFSPIILRAQEVCEQAFQLSPSLNIEQALQLSIELETLVETNFPPIAEYFSDFDPQKDASKVQEFNILLLLKCLLVSLNFSFYTFFHNKGQIERSSQYARKSYHIAWIDFSFLTKSILPILDVFFGPGTYLDMMPLFYACNKLLFISNLIRIRFSCTLWNDDQISATRSRRIIFLKQKMTHLEEYPGEFIDALSKVTKCGWWHAKSCRFGQKTFSNPQIYEFNPQLRSECVVKFSDEELRRWETLVNESKDSLQMYEELFENLMRSTGRQYLENIIHGVSSEKDLIDIVQFDKMWQLLDIIRVSLCGAYSPQAVQEQDGEAWMLDFGLLKEFNIFADFESDHWNLSNGLDGSQIDHVGND